MREKTRNLKLRSEAGQTLIEVALITPLMLALVLGAIDMGRYAYSSILVAGAARSGAAYGAQSPIDSVDAAGIQEAADDDFQNNGQDTSNLAVASSVSCGCDNGGSLGFEDGAGARCTTSGNPGLDTTCSKGGEGHWVVVVSVTASGTFNTLFKYPGIPNSIAINRTATIRVAN
jgi:Flp pilus assembly protein TadG